MARVSPNRTWAPGAEAWEQDDQSGTSSDSQRQDMVAAPSESRAMMLYSHDQVLVDVGAGAAKDFGQTSLLGSLHKTEALFESIMDPSNEDTKRLIREYLHEPMAEIYGKFKESIGSIDVEDAVGAKEKIELARVLMKLSEETREQALNHVHQNLKRQMETFAGSVQVYNQQVRETFAQALQLYEDRIKTEIQVRGKVLQQKKEEHAFMLEAFAAEGSADLERVRKRVTAQKEIDEHAAQNRERELGLQQKRDEQEGRKADLELQREQRKMDSELAREARKAEVEHGKAMRQLEALARKGQITQEARQAVLDELAKEMARYDGEFALAKEAMKNALAQRRTCHITHTAPRINWGDGATGSPPTVVPGHVSWEIRG